ncbi:transposon Tf2-1 polyprotein, partial [Trifolium pratense]
LAKLLGYSYEIVYKPGAQNRVADALSRLHETPSQCSVITIPHWDFMEHLRQSFAMDPTLQEFIQKIEASPATYPGFQIIQGLIYFRGKLYIPSDSPIKSLLLNEFHSSLIGGHSGIQKTLGRLKENVYWDNMKSDVTNFIKACSTCQQTKHPTHSPYGLLQPLPIPTGVWEDISMDFIVGLPPFQHFTVVFVVVDRFSKAAHFGMLPTHFTATKVADLFATMVSKLHGMPKSIISDRDPIFMSKFWQQLFILSGTVLRMSTAYHPQTDGQTEIVNKALQQYLRCFVHDQPKKWGAFLHWAEWHYNTSQHSSTGFTPFEVVYGKKPPSIPQYVSGTTPIEALDATLTDRETILQVLRKKLLKAQDDMKKFADKHRIPHPFKEGDFAYVKLRPYRQTSVAGHRIQKLAKRYFGPFKLIRAMGPVAFELALPPDSKIHPVFHVSQLKPCFDPTNDSSPLPSMNAEDQLVIEPLAVLGWRHDSDGILSHVLVQWAGLLPEDTSWEPLSDLKLAYPQFNLEDKVAVDGGKDVMDPVNEAQLEEPMGKGKRIKSKPIWFDDFQVSKPK